MRGLSPCNPPDRARSSTAPAGEWGIEIMKNISKILPAAVLLAFISTPVWSQNKGFQIEETTIADMQRAIQKGQTTCREVVQAYIARAKAFNGICTELVTKDGAPVSP